MPSSVVRMKPAGSFEPGCRNFAITPATKPMMMSQRIPMGPPECVRAKNARVGTKFRTRRGNYSEQSPVRREEGKRPREVADRHVMRDQVAEAIAGKPGMQMKGRRLDLERRRQAFVEVEGHRMVGGRTDGRRNAGELRERRTVDVAGGHQPHARMLPQDAVERRGVAQVDRKSVV